MPPLDTVEGRDWLKAKIEELDPDFIVFDNIMSLCGGIMKEEQSWQEIKPLLLALTKESIGQLWLHHTGHDTTRDYGTRTRRWQMDTVIVGEKVEKLADVAMTLRFEKARRRTPENWSDFEPVQVELRNGEWHRSEVEAKTSGRPNQSEAIALKALRHAVAKADGAVSMMAWREKAYE